MLPWTDRAGRPSYIKIAALIGAALPLAWLIYQAFAGELGPRPITEAIHQSGEWAIRFLWLTLLVTPLRRILDWPQLVLLRRHLGVTALAYAVLHLGLYALDQQWRLWTIASEIVLRFYLTIGFVALLGMIALGLTSFDSAIKKLGAERWNKLHWLIHPIALLAVIHFALQKKLDIAEPLVMAGLLIALWGARFLVKRKIALGPLAIMAVTIVGAAAAIGFEIAWFGVMRRISASALFLSSFDWDLAPRPAHWVLGIGLVVAVAAVVRSLLPKRQKGRGREKGAATVRATPSSATPASETAS